jgi:HSP20 family protein
METHIRNAETELPAQSKQPTRESGTYSGPYFEPRVDIYETEDALVVSADLPGAQADDIQTDVRDNLLTLTAKVQKVNGAWKPLYREYETGHYARQFRLGQHIDQSRITAQLKDGVLTLTLPKAERVKPRRIEIKSG